MPAASAQFTDAHSLWHQPIKPGLTCSDTFVLTWVAANNRFECLAASGGSGVTITSPNGTITVGGTGTAPTLDTVATANGSCALAAATTCSITLTGVAAKAVWSCYDNSGVNPLIPNTFTITTDTLTFNFSAPATGYCNASTGVGATGATGPASSPASPPNSIQFNNAGAFGGSANFEGVNTALATPAAPSINQTAAGTPGATAYEYQVVAYNDVGLTLASATGSTATGNAVLDNTNWNNIVTAAVTGSTFCVVNRITSGGTPSSIGNIGGQIACGSTLQDKGLVGDGFPSGYWLSNTTDGLYVGKNLRVAGLASFGTPTYLGAGTGYARPGVDPDDEQVDLQTLVSMSGVSTQGAYTTLVAVLDLTPDGGSRDPMAIRGTQITNPAGALDQAQLEGVHGQIVHRSSGSIGALYAAGVYGVVGNEGSGTIVNGVGVYGYCAGGGSITNCYAFYAPDQAGVATNPYYMWADSRGVYRIKEDSTFDSVGQAIAAVYNPQFAKYSPGATDFERLVEGRWNGNVAEIGTEKGGSGTLRDLRLIGAHVQTAAPVILNGNVVNPFEQAKNTQSATAPGAGFCDLRWIAGTNSGTGKIVAACGTSATEVVIADNVGASF